MPDLNSAMLMGRLTSDPELRYTTGGAPVCNLRMAINRKYKDKDKNDKEEVCYVTVVAWNKQAEACGEYLKKGSSLFVEGRLTLKQWEGDNKEKKSVLEVTAERIQFLDNKGRQADSSPDAGTPEKKTEPEDENVPF